MSARIDREELRKLIRAALKEALGPESPPPLRERDREGGKPQQQQHSFSPNRGGEGARLSAGVLTETKLVALAKAHSKILIGNDVAITPLARDRARELKIEIVRQKS
jgi:hypothetical protein